jgi:integrase
MGYVVKKKGEHTFTIYYENRKKDRPADVPREQVIPKSEYSRLGLQPDSSLAEARTRLKFLNSTDNLKKRNEAAVAKAIADSKNDELVDSAFLPSDLVTQFKDKILTKRMADGEKQAHYQRLLVHWNYTQRMIAALKIEPKDYADSSMEFYHHFEKSKISTSYATKVLRILNAWGQFYAKAMGAWGIEEVKNPKGVRREKIVKANHTKRGKGKHHGPAAALTPAALSAKSAKQEMSDAHYNWLYLSVWLGLRPEEIENLKAKPDYHRFETHDGVKVIFVFQTKLTAVEEEKAWKPIPLLTAEQRECVSIIKSGEFKKPLNKTLRRAFPELRITAYSGRKGFTDLMLSYDQELEQISVWLGHQSIEMTWKYYKSKQKVKFKRVA